MDTSTHQWTGTISTANIPTSRDPFINAPIISVGKNEQGIERFWISTYNDNCGTIGVLIEEQGRERIYRFPAPHSGFYSAVAEDDNTLWLCGDLSRVVRLTLDSGEYKVYETGAPSALVFQGMAIDKTQKKLFALAYPETTTMAFSFDYAAGKSARIYHDVYENSAISPDAQAHYARFSFPNRDGTISMIVVTPGAALLCWNPGAETLKAQLLSSINPEKWQRHKTALEKYFDGVLALIGNDEGHYYLPFYGWYNPLENCIMEGPTPQSDMNWFDRCGDFYWGSSSDANNCTIAQWNTKTGAVKDICTVPDLKNIGMCLSQNQKIIAVSLYGEFRCYDAFSGALEITRWLPTNSIGSVDCLCRIDDERLLGTPFITQRFWEANIKTGTGYDCGRAANGVGEVLLTWNINQKIYMASYTESELTEYSPDVHPHFPENPRLVAQPPNGMRPVASTQNGSVLYYSSSHHYGHLGCALTRFDTRTGEAFYRDNPLPDLCINTWHYDEGLQQIIAGTTIHADSRSCPPTQQHSVFAIVNPQTLEIIRSKPQREKIWQSLILGKLSKSTYLTENFYEDGSQQWHILTTETLESVPFNHYSLNDPHLEYIKYTGKPGYYIWSLKGQFELWNMNQMERVRILHSGKKVHRCFVQDDTVYLATQDKIIILEGCLRTAT